MSLNGQDRYDNANINFMELEKKLNTILSRCTDDNLTDVYLDETDSITYELRSSGIEKCNIVEAYKLDGLYIYRLSNGAEPIDYFMSNTPLYIKEVINNSRGNRIMKPVSTKASFLEYSKGGFYNSVSIKLATGDKYTMPKFIGLCHDGNDLVPDLRVLEGGSSLKVEGAQGVGDFVKYVLSSTNRDASKAFNNGDLFSYIYSIKPDRQDRILVDQYKNVVSKIDEVYLKIQKENLQSKKNLISKFFKKDSASNYDAFSYTFKKKN